MPIVCCAIFLLPVMVFSVLAGVMPKPSGAEVKKHSARVPMPRSAQWAFIKKYWLGLACVSAAKTIIMAVKDFRDCFQAELWSEIYPNEVINSSTFVLTEIPVALVVLIGMSSLTMVTDHRKSILVQLGLILFGCLLMLVSQLAFTAGIMSGFWWFTLIGCGAFVIIAPMGTMFFDFLMGALREPGTAVFMIGLTDVSGYLGTIALLTYKSVMQSQNEKGVKLELEAFFSGFVLVASSLSAILVVISMVYWKRTFHTQTQAPITAGICLEK